MSTAYSVHITLRWLKELWNLVEISEVLKSKRGMKNLIYVIFYTWENPITFLWYLDVFMIFLYILSISTQFYPSFNGLEWVTKTDCMTFMTVKFLCQVDEFRSELVLELLVEVKLAPIYGMTLLSNYILTNGTDLQKRTQGQNTGD